MATTQLRTTCCIAGGGPAGMMLGYLLARQGVHVTVLEKHRDFFRDFRGDTVHPSTLEVLKELGLLEGLLKIPHQRVEELGVVIGDSTYKVADFRHVPATCKFVALMPQWDFLDFLCEQAKQLPSFRLLMQHEVAELIQDGERVTGVMARNNGRDVEVRADLVVGCDGRHSVTRQAAGLEVTEQGVPIDVLWFRLTRYNEDPTDVFGHVNFGKALILIDRSDYFQAGLIIPKGSYDDIRAQGIEAFRASLLQVIPWLGRRVNELRGWDQVKILTVQINRLKRWHLPGLLCIGDAAHAMSPAGGVGINLAIQDGIATANMLASPLLNGDLTEADLVAVQRRRTFPTVVTQAIQLMAHRGLAKAFKMQRQIEAPWQVKVAQYIPGIHRALGHAVAIGARPEHVRGSETGRLPRLVYAGMGLAAASAACAWVAWKLVRGGSAAERLHAPRLVRSLA